LLIVERHVDEVAEAEADHGEIYPTILFVAYVGEEPTRSRGTPRSPSSRGSGRISRSPVR